MMYESKMALAIKVGGKVLRESGDTCFIPFGSEYSILVKNLNSVKAMVKITIDGVDVTDGVKLVVHPNESIDLERSIKNGNRNQGNRFKFIERTAGVENHRGVSIDDGLIRVEFEFERPVFQNHFLKSSPFDRTFADVLRDSPIIGSTERFSKGPTLSSHHPTYNAPAEVANVNNVGITAPGSVSDQKFQSVSGFIVDGTKHVMVLRLLGEAGGVQVEKPVTVSHKPKCVSCGKVNKATSKFCSECGTGLSIV